MAPEVWTPTLLESLLDKVMVAEIVGKGFKPPLVVPTKVTSQGSIPD